LVTPTSTYPNTILIRTT